MDKKTIPLIAALVLLFFFWGPIMETLGLYKPPPPPSDQPVGDTTLTQPSIDVQPVTTAEKPQPTFGSTDQLTDTAMVAETIEPDTIVITTDKLVVTLSTRGGGPVSIKLLEYDYRNDVPIELMPNAFEAAPSVLFAGGQFSTSNVNFTADRQPGKYEVNSGSMDLTYSYQAPNGGELIRRYRFYPDEYHFDLIFEIKDLPQLGFDRKYSLFWGTPLGVTEPQAESDYQSMEAVAMQAGARETLDDFDDGKLNQSLTGSTSWAGLRSKYFATLMIPTNRDAESVFARGEKYSATVEGGTVEKRLITVGLDMPFTTMTPGLVDTFKVFVGPLDYTLLAEYDAGLEDMLGIGTTPFVGWLIKPFAIGIIWLLPRMYSMIPNYGLVIIIFALLVKLVTMPLSMKSFKSMNAMKELQPKIEELKKKHKKNPQAMQQETMKLYKKHGVNPMSGCLPILPQMPLFFALFAVFRSTILLRDAPFVWFIDDLSVGAVGFFDPYIILVIIMVAAQFISQKLTMATSQQNKALTYMMPVLMGFLFHSLPAGLILYWTCFSAFSLIDYFAFKRNSAAPVKTAEV